MLKTSIAAAVAVVASLVAAPALATNSLTCDVELGEQKVMKMKKCNYNSTSDDGSFVATSGTVTISVYVDSATRAAAMMYMDPAKSTAVYLTDLVESEQDGGICYSQPGDAICIYFQ